MGLLHCLPPIVDARAQVLILGSFPSEASLAAGQYYAHPRNQFWPMLATVIGQPLVALPYAERVPLVQAAGIAIWDVYASCRREGSLDTAIRDGKENDFALLLRAAPGLRRVCFNGRAAARFAPRLAEAGLETVVLPSTSPAHAGMSFAAKVACWQEALRP